MKWVVCILLFATCAYADPSVSNVSGTLTNGQSITITGTGFGSTGPTVTVYDEFEKGTVGNEISKSTGSATVNEWTRVASDDVGRDERSRYSSTYAHSGTKSAWQDWYSGSDSSVPLFARNLGAATSVYAQFWTYVPVGGHVPGYGSVSGTNWKTWLIYQGPTSGLWDADTSCSYGAVILTDIDSWPMTGSGFAPLATWYDNSGRSSLQSSQGGYHDTDYASLNIAAGVWERFEVYLTASSSSAGTLGAWQMSANQARAEMGYTTGLTTTHSAHGNHWDMIQFPAFGRGENNYGTTYYDDVYVATGSGALARVEIGNNATYSSCTNLATCTPTSWGDTSITATLRSGTFSSGTAYLFVTDSSGVTSAGKEITFGEESSTPAPPTISNVTISNGRVQ